MRLRSLVAALALLGASCGGNGGALPFDEPTEGETEAAIDALVARWGDQPSFYAVMASLDRGYSAEQVIKRADDLAADGTIPLVAPDGPGLAMLRPLPSSEGAVSPRIAAAPRRLVAGGDDLSPQNQFVDFVDASLGELFDSARAKLDREAAFEQEVVELTILLGASGYSVEQIVEALITDSWDITINDALAPCYVIADGDDLVLPARVPLNFVNRLCPGVFTTTSTSTSSSSATSTTGAGLIPGTGALDGVYEGSAQLLIGIGEWEILSSEVRAVISGDDMELDLVYELYYHARYINETPSCTAVVRDSWHGLGFVVDGLVELNIAPVTREIVSLSGSDCDVAYSDGTARDSIMAEFDAEASYAVLGSIGDSGVLTGEFGDFVSFTATK